ncbi:cytochrome C assembly family protein [Alteromonas sp. CYL-A6]|uniref:cytochrome C assembly family protein n=1 Tax=Alteromonas nitratireducens TaxID=3390813 RepID=UPI0034BA5390
METLFAVVATVFYALASIRLITRLAHQDGPNMPVALMLAIVGVAFHLAYLVIAILQAPGQNMSVTNVLSLVSWLISAAMVMSVRLLPTTVLMPVVFAFTALTVLAAWLVPASHIMHIELHPGLVVHIALSLFAYCVLVIAFLYALQMSFITHKLKQKGASLLHSSLPPLMLVEQIVFKLLAVGTALLLVAQLSGFAFLDNMFSKTYAHKTVLSLMALAVFLLLLIGQRLWGWRGKQVIGLTVIGVVLLSLGYFGSRVVREFLL